MKIASITRDEVLIRPYDTLHSLCMKEIDSGLKAVCEAIGFFERGEVPRLPNDPSRATYFSCPTREAVRRFRERGRSFF